jgi:hypothetical protein
VSWNGRFMGAGVAVRVLGGAMVQPPHPLLSSVLGRLSTAPRHSPWLIPKGLYDLLRRDGFCVGTGISIDGVGSTDALRAETLRSS